ncbi:MAG: ABC transporter ATP-binding protein [Planctomycetota bacterium]
MSPDSPAEASVPTVPAVQIQGLSHRYPKADRDALDGLSLTIQPGEAFALLGPNGGGKTTTFRILATLLQPSGAGPAAVQLVGHDVLRQPAAARRTLGVVFQSPSLDIKLTARENLTCQARLYGLTRRESIPRIDEALARFDLTGRMHDAVETFSGGMKRKLEIAKALLHRPRLLLMDEPATGLDPAARRELWEHLGELRQRHDLTIAWTTHLMDEAEHADRLAVLASGKILTVSSPAELKASLGGHVVTAQPLHPEELDALRDRIDAELGPWPAGKAPAVIQDAVRFEHPDGPAIVTRVSQLLPGELRRISVGQPTLEDAYLRLIAGADA